MKRSADGTTKWVNIELNSIVGPPGPEGQQGPEGKQGPTAGSAVAAQNSGYGPDFDAASTNATPFDMLQSGAVTVANTFDVLTFRFCGTTLHQDDLSALTFLVKLDGGDYMTVQHPGDYGLDLYEHYVATVTITNAHEGLLYWDFTLLHGNKSFTVHAAASVADTQTHSFLLQGAWSNTQGANSINVHTCTAIVL